jgi:hypothetical protein
MGPSTQRCRRRGSPPVRHASKTPLPPCLQDPAAAHASKTPAAAQPRCRACLQARAAAPVCRAAAASCARRRRRWRTAGAQGLHSPQSPGLAPRSAVFWRWKKQGASSAETAARPRGWERCSAQAVVRREAESGPACHLLLERQHVGLQLALNHVERYLRACKVRRGRSTASRGDRPRRAQRGAAPRCCAARRDGRAMGWLPRHGSALRTHMSTQIGHDGLCVEVWGLEPLGLEPGGHRLRGCPVWRRVPGPHCDVRTPPIRTASSRRVQEVSCPSS